MLVVELGVVFFVVECFPVTLLLLHFITKHNKTIQKSKRQISFLRTVEIGKDLQDKEKRACKVSEGETSVNK